VDEQAAQAARAAPATPAQAAPAFARTEVEQVIHRALELQDRSQGTSRAEVPLSLDDLIDIGGQLGIAPTVLQQALRDVRLAQLREPTPAGLQRLLGQPAVRGARLVTADPARVHAATAAWLAEDEGLVRTGTRGDAEQWVRDKRLLVNLRRGLQVDRGTGALRDLHEIAVRVLPEEGGAVVHVEADTTRIRTTGTAIAVGGALLSTLIGVGAAAVAPEVGPIGEVGQFALGFVPAATATMATTAMVTRRWMAEVREGLDRALDGIAMTTHEPRSAAPASRPEGWRRTAARWLGGR
jgi:hypothetical protein